MDVAYTTGTVTTFNGSTGLLKAITDWVAASGGAGRDWTLEVDQNAKETDGITDVDGSNLREVILSNTGLSGNENIIVGIREYRYQTENEYNLELNGYLSVPPAWNSHAAATHQLDGYDTTRNHWTELPLLQCFDNEMEYWIYSSQEFIAVSIRVGTSYYQCYLGNGKRLGSPSEYPYPLVVAGSGVGNVSYQDGGNGPVRPAARDSTPVAGEFNCFFVDAQGTFNTTPFVEPMQGNSQTLSVDETDGGAAFMCPAFYRDSSNTFLQLFNCFVVRTVNMLSESTYTDPVGRQYRIFAQGLTDYDYEFLAFLEDIGTTTSTTTSTSTTSTTTTV